MSVVTTTHNLTLRLPVRLADLVTTAAQAAGVSINSYITAELTAAVLRDRGAIAEYRRQEQTLEMMSKGESKNGD